MTVPPSRKAGFRPRILSGLALPGCSSCETVRRTQIHWRDLAGKTAIRYGFLRARQRGQRVIILRLARELKSLGAIFGECSHQTALVIGVFEAVEEHVIDHLAMAEAIAGARPVEQIGRVGHALHAAGDDDIGAAGEDQVMGEHGRLHARAAHFVDRRRARRSGQPGAEPRLPGGRLSLPGGQHAAKHHFVDLIRRQSGPAQRRLDGGGAELGGCGVLEIALKAAHGGAGGTDDDDRVSRSHFVLLKTLTKIRACGNLRQAAAKRPVFENRSGAYPCT